MADNCGVCLELPDKYGCGWCGDQCDVQEECSKRSHSVGHSSAMMMWLNKQQTCPDPQILNFYPKSGPWEGGTNLTIEGVNLGRSYEDILGGVYIAYTQHAQFVNQINCLPFAEEYVKTSKIVCQISSPNITSPTKTSVGAPPSGHVVVRIQNEYTARSRDVFSFVNPKITHIEPSKGPKSGGTRLIIWGLNMDAGSTVEAFLGPYQCRVTRREKNQAECITSGRNSKGEEKVRVRFDAGIRSFEDYKFLFVDDPEIISVESGSSSSSSSATSSPGRLSGPRGIPGGGITISVKGSNLNSVQRPLMYVEVEGVKYNSSCVVESAVDMKCKSPRVPLEKLSHLFSDSDGDPLELHYGFIMDDVSSVQSLTSKPYGRFPRFQMYPNPLYLNFSEPEGIKYYKSDYLTINVSTFSLLLHQ